MSLPHILCVDDESNVLDGLSRILRKKYEVHKATSGDLALSLLDSGQSFAAVVSDMRMPKMNGAVLLARFKERAPDTTRLLLTGYADLESAIAAVNDGHVFRFLTKPCPPEVLLSALDAATAQHRLITAERELLEKTLVGSIRALTEALALARPEAFRNSTLAHERARAIAEKLKVPHAWHVEVASMIACVGYVVLPPEVIMKIHVGAPLDPAEREMVGRLPAMSERILAHIPRLEDVRETLKHSAPHDGATRQAKDAPIGAAILAIVHDLGVAEAREGDTARAIASLKEQTHAYDSALLEAMAEACAPVPPELRSLCLGELRTGMVLAADVKGRTGIMLVASGQRVTAPLLERLRNFSSRIGVVEPIICEVHE